METMTQLTWQAITLRVVLCMIIGGIIGLERGFKNQAAGSRTYMLVCVSACLVMMTNQYVFDVFHNVDPTRLGAQVISGIGFLGAGTILVTSNQRIRGLTTAAGLWSAACIGIAIGIGFYAGVFAVTVVLILILTVFRRLDKLVQSRSKYIHLYMDFESAEAVTDFMEECRKDDIKLEDIQMSRGSTKGEVFATLTLKNPRPTVHSEILTKFTKIEGIRYIEEI